MTREASPTSRVLCGILTFLLIFPLLSFAETVDDDDGEDEIAVDRRGPNPKLNSLFFGKRNPKLNSLFFGKRNPKLNSLFFGKREPNPNLKRNPKLNSLFFGKRAPNPNLNSLFFGKRSLEPHRIFFGKRTLKNSVDPELKCYSSVLQYCRHESNSVPLYLCLYFEAQARCGVPQ